MENILERLDELVNELNSDTSINNKKLILCRYDDCKDILGMIYSPYKKFYVTGDNIKTYDIFAVDNRPTHFVGDIMELLNNLCDKVVSGNDAIYDCLDFLSDNSEYYDLIINILNKDLRCGIGINSLNAVWPGLIYEFSIPLAKEYIPARLSKHTWYVSRKLDGVRCLCFIGLDKTCTFYSRNGHVFTSLNKVAEEIKRCWQGPTEVILDGEVCIMDSNGIEDFSGIVGLIKRKNYTLENPRYYVFNTYTYYEFFNHISHHSFSDNYKLLSAFIHDSPIVKVLNQTCVCNQNELDQCIGNRPAEWEGLIVRKDAPAKFSRSYDIMKIKNFKEDDYCVRGILLGIKKIDGIDREVCSDLIIVHKGCSVRVGSGLSDKQRIDWCKDPDLIKNRIITVKYFSESTNKDGGMSLRFPILKSVRDYE